MSEKNNTLLKSISENSEQGKNITENEWNKIKNDKENILSKASNYKIKQVFLEKYKELDDKFKENGEEIHSTTTEEIDLFKKIFLLDSFGVGKEVKDSLTDLNNINLDLSKLLSGYNNYIEIELKSVPKNIKTKIKEAIGIKLSKISNIIKEYKNKSNEEWIPIENYRWIINEEIIDLLKNINTKVLPSAKFLSIYDSINKNESGISKSSIEIGGKKYSIRLSDKKEEIEEMLHAELDENGNFDEGFFSTQTDIIDTSTISGDKIAKKYNIKTNESTSLLNEKDKEIESNAQIGFMAVIGAIIANDMASFTGLWTIPGMIVGVAYDSGDIINHLINNEDAAITLLKNITINGEKVIPSEYRMKTHWYDTILAGIGIIPGATIVTKGIKLSKFTSKLSKKQLNKFNKIKEKINSNIFTNKNPKTLNKTDNINKEIQKNKLDLSSKLFKSFSNLFDKNGKYIIKTPEDIKNIDKILKGKSIEILTTTNSSSGHTMLKIGDEVYHINPTVKDSSLSTFNSEKFTKLLKRESSKQIKSQIISISSEELKKVISIIKQKKIENRGYKVIGNNCVTNIVDILQGAGLDIKKSKMNLPDSPMDLEYRLSKLHDRLVGDIVYNPNGTNGEIKTASSTIGGFYYLYTMSSLALGYGLKQSLEDENL